VHGDHACWHPDSHFQPLLPVFDIHSLSLGQAWTNPWPFLQCTFYNGTRVNPCMALSTDSAVNTVLHALHLCGTAELSHLPLYQPTPTYVPSQTMQRQLDNILCVLMLGTCSGHCTEALTVSCKSGWHHHPAFSFHTISCLVTKCKASKGLHKR
jgi:hypothetical protein